MSNPEDILSRMFPKDVRIRETHEILQTSIFNTTLNRVGRPERKNSFISYVFAIVDTIAIQMQDVRFAI
ncbi:MAG: hypothetical protein M3Y53_08455 [Thermoproteota archaeon]|nr:hypothetical protein [Thermoproteota archaeon]